MISREEARNILVSMTRSESLLRHMRTVELVLEAYAEKLGEDKDEWAIAGLLHDADWEKYPDDHCLIIIEELEKRNIDPDVIHCIASHGPSYFGVEPNNKMDKMIYAFDELSGFVHAAALIRPTRYEGLEVKSVLKRLKSPAFAAQVSREDINDAISRINTSLEEIIQFIIDHQKDVN